MWQRIQSVWLALASMAGLSGIKLSTYMGANKNGIPGDTLEATDSVPLLIATIAVGIISLLTIFLFRNRSLQLKLIMLAAVLQLVVLFLYYQQITHYLSGQLTLTSVLQAAVIIFLGLAWAGVSKDNKIIRESNRLR